MRVGVEFMRFFLGDEEPMCELVSLDGGFSVGKWEDIAEHFVLYFRFCILRRQANREKHSSDIINFPSNRYIYCKNIDKKFIAKGVLVQAVSTNYLSLR